MEHTEKTPFPVGLAVALAVAYFATGIAGMLFKEDAWVLTPLWLPTGVALGFFLLVDRRFWPALTAVVAVADTAVLWLGGLKLANVAWFIPADCFEPLFAAWLIRKGVAGPEDRMTLRGATIFAAGCFGGAVAGTAIGFWGLARLVAELDSGNGIHRPLSLWLVGDFLSLYVVAPFIIAVIGTRTNRNARKNGATALELAALVSVLTLIFFFDHLFFWSSEFISPIASGLFPCLVWAAIRCSSLQSATIALLVTVVPITVYSLPVAGLDDATQITKVIGFEFQLVMSLIPFWFLHVAYHAKSRAERWILRQGKIRDALVSEGPDRVIAIDRKRRVLFSKQEHHITTGIEPNYDIRMRSVRLFDMSGNEVPYEDWPIIRALRGEHVQGARMRITECKGSGDWVYLINAAPVLDEHGEVWAAIGVGTDITELTELHGRLNLALERERAARHDAQNSYEEAVAANRFQEQLIANISHELRTPISVIASWLHILKTRELTASESERAIQTMQDYAKQQVRLIDQLLTSAKMHRGETHYAPRLAEITTLLERLVESFRFEAERKRIELSLDVPSQRVSLVTEEEKLEQILVNLLSNALKFTEPGGRVVVAMNVAGDRIEIFVRDTGVGIDPKFLPHVFDRFRQERTGFDREYSGLGIGLSIVKDLVTSIHGEIAIHSEGRGKGTEVMLRLPLLSALTGQAPTP